MKTLVTAVDAATAENPTAKKRSTAAEPSSIPRPGAERPPTSTNPQTRVAISAVTPPPAAPVQRVAQSAARTVARGRGVKKGLARGSRRFGEAVWSPFVRLSGVLWLEVSGVFFGVFALLALGYLWKLRGAWHAGANASHRSLLSAIVMFALFGYFCVSSFVRARRRERRR